MSTTELREKRIGKIQLTHDDSILEEVSRVLDVETALSGTYLLSPLEKAAIELGKKDILDGRMLNNEEVLKEIDFIISL